MKLFPEDITLEQLNDFSKNSIVEYLGIEFIEIGKDYLSAKMPVDHRTIQPMKILHGGASVVLAETLGSVGSHLCLNSNNKISVGLDVNANHIRPATSGFVFGKAKATHIGRSTHIWQIDILNEEDKLVCTSRLTVAIIDKK